MRFPPLEAAPSPAQRPRAHCRDNAPTQPALPEPDSRASSTLPSSRSRTIDDALRKERSPVAQKYHGPIAPGADREAAACEIDDLQLF
jgi:hypothetical protein